ncbi:MAG TPA: ABC transporter substrate-binding protein, partial [Tepidisphaeraceae bacterium]|nr:ABC transporter substrate-binding protein [Tepidisphaeraceae bacterium]
YDVDPKLSGLPKVGDYLTTDWERIAPLHPGLIITQYAQGRTPAGFAQRVQDLGATQLNLHIDRLEDIYSAGLELADAVKEHDKGVAAIGALKEQIESVRHAVAGEAPVPALIVVGPEGSSIAGPGTYLDDLLRAAGGKNVAEEMNTAWPTIDRERLASFQPQVIIQLLASSSPQVRQQAELVWQSLPEVPAVKNGRVVRLSEWYVMEPGYQVGRLTRQFAAILHPAIKLPQSTTKLSTRQAPSADGAPAR